MRLFHIVLSLLVFTILTYSQNNNELVKIGDKVITLEEFKFRYELTPQIDRKYNDSGKSKEELLYTLIAEKIICY